MSSNGTRPERAEGKRLPAASRFAALVPNGGGFESSRYLGKWLLLGTAIGIVAGLGAVVFSRAIALATRLLLGNLAGFYPPRPIGEGSPVIYGVERPWALPLVVALGGLLSGLLVWWLAPEAKGHGTDAAIAAIHHKGGKLRARVPPVKLVASAITIGSGGSAGREGPAAQISAGFASMLGQWLKLDPHDRRIAVAAGMGAGIGAIFRAPLGGAVMSAEILYLHDLEVEALVPGLIASIVGYSIFGWFEGWVPIFGAQPDLAFVHPLTLVYYAALGIICGLGGLLYSWSFYSTEHLFDRLSVPPWIKPAIGGLLVGLIGLKVHGALHTGYGWVQIDMTEQLKALPLWIVLILPLAKILATSLSIGSGGSGGIFGPGMVIGGTIGAAFWRLGDGVLPQMPHTPAPFVIVGMMALFGGIAHAPLAMMLMVAEMTGNLSLLAPAMVAVALSTALVGDHTIYANQLPSRADSPAHRIRFGFPLLSSLRVRDVMRASPAASNGNGFHPSPADSNGNGLHVSPDIPLDQALESLVEADGPATVVDGNAVIGTLSARDVVAGYRAAMARGVRRVGALNPAVSMLEARVAPGSPLAGLALRDAKLPAETLVVAITRHGEAIFPDASTRLEPGDFASVLVSPSAEEQVRDLFAAAERVSTS